MIIYIVIEKECGTVGLVVKWFVFVFFLTLSDSEGLFGSKD